METARLNSRKPARQVKGCMTPVIILLPPLSAACASDSSQTSSGANFCSITP